MRVRETFLFIIGALYIAISGTCEAAQVITTVSEGTIYNLLPTGSVGNTGVYTSSYIDGDIKFSAQPISKPVSNAMLKVWEVGTPIWDQNVQVFGFGSNVKALDISDIGAGSFIGTMDVSSGLGTLDITSFVNSMNSPYLGFRLVTTSLLGGDAFGSHALGHPSEISFASGPGGGPVDGVPENSVWIMMIAGFGLIGAAIRRRPVMTKAVIAND